MTKSGSAARVPPPEADVILRHIADGLVLLDRDGRIVYTNASFRAMVGRGGDDLTGLRWSDLTDAQTSERLDPAVSREMAEEQLHFNIDLPTPAGTCATYCLMTSDVRDADGRPIGVLQNFRSMDRLRDVILQLKEVSAAIQREKERADQVLDSIADGIFTVDADLVIRSFSARMERLTGMTAASVLGRPCRDVFRGSKCNADCPLRWSLLHDVPVARCHEYFHLSDGRQLPVTITTAFLNDSSGAVTGLTGVVRDETEREHPGRKRRPAGQSYPDDAREELHRALDAHRWNATRTARALGISRTTLWRRMRRHGLQKRT